MAKAYKLWNKSRASVKIVSHPLNVCLCASGNVKRCLFPTSQHNSAVAHRIGKRVEEVIDVKKVEK